MSSPITLPNRNILNIHSIDKPPPLPIPSNPKHHVIPRHHPLPHLTLTVKCPIFQTIAPLPLHPVLCILIFVPELHGDAVIGEGEQLFAETVGMLLFPLFGQKFDYGVGACEEGSTIAPDAVGGVSCCYLGGVSMCSQLEADCTA